MKAAIGGCLLAAAAAWGLGQPAWAQPSAEQQKCLAALGKGALKLAKVQGKANRSCAKALAKGKLEGSAEDCLSADAKGKRAKTAAKNLDVESSRCAGAAAPDLGSAGAAAANDAAGLAETDLAHDLFGDPVDDGLVSCDPDRAACACQAKALSAAEKLFATLGKTHGVCKKKRFKAGEIVGQEDLEGCLDDPEVALSVEADTKGKLAKTRAKLAATVEKTCDGPGVSTTSFPGACDGLAGAALAGCLADRVECRFCQLLNAAEASWSDCDDLDDAVANGSCQNLSCPAGENACPSGCTDLDTDESNCGACGATCGEGQTCTLGLCL